MTSKNTSSTKRLYELNCLVPLRESGKINAIAKNIMDFIEKEKGEIMEAEKTDDTETPGSKSRVWLDKRKLAYPIKNDKGGFYLNSWFKIEPENLTELRRYLKLEKDVIRYEILAEDNISSIRPTPDSVRLDELDKLIAARTQSPVEEKPRSYEKIKDVKPKPRVAAEIGEEKTSEQAPEKSPMAEDKISKVDAATGETKSEVEKTVATVKAEVKKELGAEAVKKEEEKESALAKPAADKQPDEEEEKKGSEKLKKPKKISLEDLDKRLDDILNEEIL